MSRASPTSGRPANRDGWISPRARVRWGIAVRAALAAEPEATVEQLAARTGAPPQVVRQVGMKWRERQGAPTR
jgi:hypothetical protein